ncbi:nucleopolyhedrovirus P10 family protein [Streptomyces sp. NPDC047071]|uniref:nucleopolyhedrovirus P10 family protein n=1 Tax=Streptomyces sp. NPDC047071 TaxID=3154808 RepID=UPI00345228B5
MTGDGWAAAVRRQLGLGRVLPLGGAGDGAWLTEAAATAVLRRAAERVTGARLTAVRVAPAGPEAAGTGGPPGACERAVPAPPSALPPGPLCVSGEVAAGTAEPLPALASRLRAALATAAADRLGLVVARVDLRVTELCDEPPGPGERQDRDGTAAPARDAAPADPAEAGDPADPEDPADTGGPADPAGSAAEDSPEGRIARAVLAVPGVSRLTGVFGGLGRAVHVRELASPDSLPRRHVQVELAVAADRRALDVARAVRTAVGGALPDRPSVAVLVTAVDEPGHGGAQRD